MEILGAILKAIFDPLFKVIFMVFYGILIRGPLNVLNTENKILDFASGSYTDKLLFDTTLVDGKPQLNFFSSESPLRIPFLTMIGIAGVLVALGFGFAIFHSLTDRRRVEHRDSPVKRISKLVFASALIVFIPIMFLITLSLSGSLLTALASTQRSTSATDVTAYQQITQNNLVAILNLNPDKSREYDRTEKFGSPEDGAARIYSNEDKNIANKKSPDYIPDYLPSQTITKTIDEIYTNLTQTSLDPEETYYKVSSDIANLATRSRDLYNSMINAWFERNNDVLQLKPTVKKDLEAAQNVIINLKDGEHSEEQAGKLKTAVNTLLLADLTIVEWQASVKALQQYKAGGEPKTAQDAALANLNIAYEQMVGKEQTVSPVINAFTWNKLHFAAVKTANDPQNGLWELRQKLVTQPDSDLTVIFYQVVTGNKDTNWDQTFVVSQNGSAMLIIGFGMIIGAIILMALVILEAFIRVFILAALFILSPFTVAAIIFDDGARFRAWVTTVLVQMISLFGTLILIRLAGKLTLRFQDIIASSPLGGNYLAQSIATAVFAFASLSAAIRAKNIVAEFVGAGQGIRSAIDTGASYRTLMSVGKASTFGALALGGRAMRVAGLSSKGVASGGMPGAPKMDRRSAFAQTWKNRNPITKVNNATAVVSRGRFGSANARNTEIARQASIHSQKADSALNKINARNSTSSNLKDLSAAKNKASEAKSALKSAKRTNQMFKKGKRR